MGTSLSFACRSHALFETCCGGGLWLLVRARGDTRWTEPILKCFSGPFCPRSHRCCASTLLIQNARQPSSAFCCALGGWWLGRCGVAGAPVVHLRGGARAKCRPWGGLHRDFCRHPSHLCPYSSRFLFFFLAPFDVRPGPGYAWPRRGSWVPTLIRGPAIAGHTSKKKQAEIRKAMSVRLAIIAAEGRGGVFFPPPP